MLNRLLFSGSLRVTVQLPCILFPTQDLGRKQINQTKRKTDKSSKEGGRVYIMKVKLLIWSRLDLIAQEQSKCHMVTSDCRGNGKGFF